MIDHLWGGTSSHTILDYILDGGGSKENTADMPNTQQWQETQVVLVAFEEEAH